MRFMKVVATVLAIVGGSFALHSAPASATPLAGGSLAGATTSVGQEPLVAKAQYYGRREYRPYRRVYRAYPTYRRAYRPRRVYRPYRVYRPNPVYRGRTVCRIRHTPYGTRRVCFRR